MPIQVKIEVNGRPVQTVHIGREKGGTSPDDMNTYVVLAKWAIPGTPFTSPSHSPEPAYKEWEEGIRFEHRYGDGITVCVEKALEALNSKT